MPLDVALRETEETLAKHGFGVLTRIDVKETLKKKIGAEFRPYHILGACNPQMAHRALLAEDKIGTMLPCNVIVQEKRDSMVEIAAVDPVASMQAIHNPALEAIAQDVRSKLQAVVGEISRKKPI
jgi:uncharacterized protein (DUF302 family)